MKNLSHFRDQYRARIGKPPMLHRNSQKQSAFLQRSKLVDIFKGKVNPVHNTTYFTHPDDIKDIEKENAKINAQIKIFFSRCDEDLDKATKVIEFYAGEYGEWCNWKPSICFRKETVQDYENKSVKQNKPLSL